MKLFKNLFIVMIIAVILVSGCNQSRFSSFNQIMEEMVTYREKMKWPDSYFLETVTTEYENKSVVRQTIMKKWYDDQTGKERMEMHEKNKPVQYSVFDGAKRMIYTEGEPKALTMGVPNNPIVKQESMIDSTIQMLQQFSDTHEISLLGEEDIDGASTYHLKLKAKDQNAISGDKEIWINLETWMMKKFINEIGNTRQETLFKKYEANPKNLDEKFTLELPKDVEIVEEQPQSKMLSLGDIKSYFNQSFYYFPSTEDIQMLPGTNQNGNIDIPYLKNNLTYFTLFLKKSNEAIQGDYTIRGIKAKLTKENGLGYTLTWIESGIQYTIIDFANVLKKEELFQIAKDMKKFE